MNTTITINSKNLMCGELCENLAFNSAISVGGKTFLATNNGIVEISANESDNGKNSSTLITGKIDFGIPNPKRLRSFAASIFANGRVRMFIYDSDTDTVLHEQIVSVEERVMSIVEINIPRSIVRRYWQFGVSSVDGSRFLVSKMWATVIPRPTRLSVPV